MRFLSVLFSLLALLSIVFGKKVRYPMYLYTTKELDNTQILRSLMVVSSLPFYEVRFTKDSEAKKFFFDKIKSLGYLTPSIPVLSDPETFNSYISTEEAISQYILLSYYKELYPSTISEYIYSIQAASLMTSYMKKLTNILSESITLPCTKILTLNDIKHLLNVLEKKRSESKSKYFYGEKYTYIDVSLYNLILFIENVSPGCVIRRYPSLTKLAFEFSQIPQVLAYERSPHFLSLTIPGTRAFAKPINFVLMSKAFDTLSN